MKPAAPQTSAVKPMRNSNIELLRLAAMWIIVAHHFTVHNANPVAGFGDPLTRAFYNVLLYPTGRTASGVDA